MFEPVEQPKGTTAALLYASPAPVSARWDEFISNVAPGEQCRAVTHHGTGQRALRLSHLGKK